MQNILPFFLLHVSFFLPLPKMFQKKGLVIHACDLDTVRLDAVFYKSRCVLFIPHCDMNTVYFFYNCGWVLFTFDCDLDITVIFFTTLDECCLFLIVIRTSPVFFFFTTLVLIVIWISLFIFLQSWMGVVYSRLLREDCGLKSKVAPVRRCMDRHDDIIPNKVSLKVTKDSADTPIRPLNYACTIPTIEKDLGDPHL